MTATKSFRAADLSATELKKKDAGNMLGARKEHVERLLRARLRSVTTATVVDYMRDNFNALNFSCTENGLGDIDKADEWNTFCNFAQKQVSGEKTRGTGTADKATPVSKATQAELPELSLDAAERKPMLLKLTSCNLETRSIVSGLEMQAAELLRKAGELRKSFDSLDKVVKITQKIQTMDMILATPELDEPMVEMAKDKIKPLLEEYAEMRLAHNALVNPPAAEEDKKADGDYADTSKPESDQPATDGDTGESVEDGEKVEASTDAGSGATVTEQTEEKQAGKGKNKPSA